MRQNGCPLRFSRQNGAPTDSPTRRAHLAHACSDSTSTVSPSASLNGCSAPGRPRPPSTLLNRGQSGTSPKTDSCLPAPKRAPMQSTHARGQLTDGEALPQRPVQSASCPPCRGWHLRAASDRSSPYPRFAPCSRHPSNKRRCRPRTGYSGRTLPIRRRKR